MTALTEQAGKTVFRAGAATAVAAAFLVSWVNMAVGIAGDEDNPVNLSFFVMIAIAAVGAFAAELRAKGMARAMFGVAVIQLLLGVIVSTGPVALAEPNGPGGLFALNGFFACLWLVSAALFASAARSGYD